jgi:uncharacterized surface anchored protein
MTGKFCTAAALLLLLLPVMLFTGCAGGSGQAPYVNETPEEAVMKILDSWRSSESMNFAYDSSGKIVAQEVISSEVVSGTIEFKDLSGEVWIFNLEKIEYETSVIARIYTNYYYSGAPQFGGLKVVFKMVKDQGIWFLDGLEVTEVPAVVVTGTGVNGVITDKVTGLPVSSARVEIYSASDNLLAGYSVTDENGFYEILELAPGNYYLIVSRDGYAPYTISGIQVS